MKGTEKIVYQKAATLNRTIDYFEKGIIQLSGIHPGHVDFYRPIVVSLYPYPCHSFTWTEINGIWPGILPTLKTKNLLQQTKTKRLKILAVEEFEMLAGMHRETSPFTELIEDWDNHEILWQQSFRNYALSQKPRQVRTIQSTDSFRRAMEIVGKKLFPHRSSP